MLPQSLPTCVIISILLILPMYPAAHTNTGFSSFAATSGHHNSLALAGSVIPSKLSLTHVGIGSRICTKVTIDLSSEDYFEGIPFAEIIRYPICTLALFTHFTDDGCLQHDIAFGPGLHKYLCNQSHVDPITKQPVHLHPASRKPLKGNPEYFLLYHTRRKLMGKSLGTLNNANLQAELLSICLQEETNIDDVYAIGNFYLKQKNLSDALHWFKKAFRLSSEESDLYNKILVNLVNIYTIKHQTEQLNKSEREAKLLALFRKLHVNSHQLSTIGDYYYRNGNFDDALHWFKRALRMHQHGYLFMNLVVIHIQNQHWEKVIATGKNALETLHHENSPCGLMLNNIGYAYERIAKNPLACAYYMEACKHIDAQELALINLLYLYGNDQSSCSMVQESEIISFAHALLNTLKDNAQLLEYTHKFPERYKQAFDTAKRLTNNKESIVERLPHDERSDYIIA